MSCLPKLLVVLMLVLSLWMSEICCAKSGIITIDDLKRTGIEGQSNLEFRFLNILPNPFDQSTGIYTSFALPESCFVSITILNANLKIIYSFDQVKLGQGFYSVSWAYEDNNGSAIPAGLYYIDLSAKSCLECQSTVRPRTDLVNEYHCRHSFHAFPSEVKVPSKGK